MKQCGGVLVLCASLITLAAASDGSQQSPQGVSLQERQALIALYEATDGSHWKNHEGWLGPEGTECTWYGVECVPTRNGPATVIQLDLAENNLNGTIPEQIGDLTDLLFLTLFDNHLVGPIPDSLAHLAKLEYLDIIQNHFSKTLPDSLIQRWLSGSLWITAETSVLTDVSEIDFESSPSMLLCGRQRIVLRSDGTIQTFEVRCRNATPRDRRTYCEVKKGEAGGFAALAWLFEKNGFYAMKHEYWRNVTEGVFESTRVTRQGKTFEVVNYQDGGPFELWGIERAIEGIAFSTAWKRTTRQPTCPLWRVGSVKYHHR